METIADRIKEIREDKGLTQKALSQSVGVTSVAVSRWELGLASPKGKNLLLLAKALDVTPDWLSLGSKKENRGTKHHVTDCISVPFYPYIEASAGEGIFPVSEDIKQSIDIPSYAVAKRNVNTNNIVCLKVHGNSMEPVLNDGSIIAIDVSLEDIKDGDIYVIRQEDILRVKVLSRYSRGLRLRSYNHDYEDEFYEYKNLDDLHVIGRVFWYSVAV